MLPLLKVEQLVKDFGSFRAVDSISFTIPRGSIVGVLGKNGAGKTTTIRMLLGITTPTSGDIFYFGKNFFSHREESLQRINYISSYNTLLGRTTVWENLQIYARLYNVQNHHDKIHELLMYFEVMDIQNKIYEDLSSGQKTRVNLVKSLLNDPELILMDEPTASLDPDIADKTLSLIENWKKEKNLSILYTSHNMQEVTRICDDVLFLSNGTIVEHDTPQNLAKKVTKAELILTYERDPKQAFEYLQGKSIPYEHKHPNQLIIQTQEADIPRVIFDISKTGLWMNDITINKPTLEDFFLQISCEKNETI